MRNESAGRRKAVWWLSLGLMVCRALSGIAQEEPVRPADVLEGKRLFASNEWSATGFTCRHCHADFNEKKEPDPYVRVGHPLYNSGYRASWHRWDGTILMSLEEAIEACASRWMTTRTDSLTGVAPEQHRVRKLAAYLRSEELSPEKRSKALDLLPAEAVPSDLLMKRGDRNVGALLFRSRCSICHVSDGSGPAPSLVRNGYSRYLIAKKVRALETGGMNGLLMPGFVKDRLSERELLNVVAYVFDM